MHATDLPTACENCGTPLQGHYCHACGQSVVNPLRHAGHALEELLESFWHLDGRVFRTLRELVHPGRVASGYLAGRRARYIPPLRLFLVLSVLTFFVGRLVVGMAETTPVQVQAGGAAADAGIAQARSVAEVDRRLQAALADIDRARREGAAIPGFALAMRTAEDNAREAAATRIRELGGRPDATAKNAAAATPADPSAGTGDIDLDREGPARAVQMISPRSLRHPDRPWNEHDNPVDVSWLPEVGDHWINHKLANAERNTAQLRRDDSFFWPAVTSQVPTALFVLVPVFALLLKLFYIRSGRGYLEHLVVALYSHAFLLLGVLGLFVLLGAQALAGAGAVSATASLLKAGLWIWMPVYLLLMQKRVYAQGWPATIAKYGAMGLIYLVLGTFVLVFAVFAVFFGG